MATGSGTNCKIWGVKFEGDVILQLNILFEELFVELQSSETADDVEGSEDLLVQLNQQQEATADACISTVNEGENLLDQLR